MIRILLDSGSNKSLVRRNVANYLDLTGDPTDLTMHLAGGNTSTTTREQQVALRVEHHDGSFSTVIQATTTKKIGTLPPMMFRPKAYDHLRNIPFTDKFPMKRPIGIDVLLGEPFYSHILLGSPVLGELGEPGAQETRLGWALCATDPSGMSTTRINRLQVEQKQTMDELNSIMARFSDLETIGVKPPPEEKEIYTAEELDAVRAFQDGARYDPDMKKWIVKLPWKDGVAPDRNGPLGNNLRKAIAIMHSVEQKVKQEDRDIVNKAYKELVEKGWAEPVPEDETFPDHFWYCLITRPVIRREHPTTPARVVWDAGNKDPGSKKSLNDHLHVGPCLLNDIAQILSRFRQGKFAFALDISKMFFNIAVDPRDRDALRFVWRNFDKTSKAQIFRMIVYAFGLKPSPFVAISCVLATADMFKIDFPEAVEIIKQNLFMDDVAASDNDKDMAKKIVNDIKELLSRASFRAHKFCSNDPALLADLTEEEKVQEKLVKILGLYWNTEGDYFTFNFDDKIQPDEPVTKRLIMSQAAMLFDLLGFFAPFTLSYKFILEEVWQRKLNYDDPVSADLQQKWDQWKSGITMLKEIRIPRWTGWTKNSKTFLAVFGDASGTGYGAVAYLVVKNGNSITTSLMMAKSRLPPSDLKPNSKKTVENGALSIVRLELLAALLATHIGVYVAKALNMDKTNIEYFSDSVVTLLRIQAGRKNWKQWVANRIEKILDVSAAEQWHYVPTDQNSADLVSRGCSASDLVSSALWWQGPHFLRKEKSEWPKQPVRRKTEEEQSVDDLETLKERLDVQIYTVQIDETNVYFKLLERNEKWGTILRVLAFAKRFIKGCRKQPRNKGHITIEEMREAEKEFIMYAQKQHFAEEIKELKKGESVSKKSRLKDLDVKLDEGLIVHQSRLRLAESVPFTNPEPVILPKDSAVTDKIVMFVHKMHLHSGIETTHLLLRRHFWVIGGRKHVKKIIRTCKTPKCRPIANLALKMSPLPVDRIENPATFKYCACDMFGPMQIKANGEGKKVTKAYGCVFSCFHSRAIHLELVPDLTTEAFLMALRRFSSRMGMPTKLYSDQAKTFMKAAKELKGLYALDINQIQQRLNEEGCEWIFSTPRAAFLMGIAERSIGLVKVHLRKVLHGALLTADEMRTVMAEVEAIVNNRPISCLKDESLVPITPAELLIGRPLTALPDYDENMETDYAEMWQRKKALLRDFWVRWQKAYLTELSPTRKWRKKDEHELNVGDVVLLRDPDMPRNSWKLARVSETYQNERGETTSAKIRLPSGRPLVRNIRHLALLEADMTVKGPATDDKNDHGAVIYDNGEREKPRRSERTRRVPARYQN